MPNRLTTFLCAGAALFTALTVVNAQTSSPAAAPSSSPLDTVQKAPLAETKTKPATPPLPTAPSTKSDNLLLVQATTSNAATSPAPATSTTTSTTTTTAAGPVEPDTVSDSGGVAVREFQGDDVGAVLRLLARQAKINMVVSEAVAGTVTGMDQLEFRKAVPGLEDRRGLFRDHKRAQGGEERKMIAIDGQLGRREVAVEKLDGTAAEDGARPKVNELR